MSDIERDLKVEEHYFDQYVQVLKEHYLTTVAQLRRVRDF